MRIKNLLLLTAFKLFKKRKPHSPLAQRRFLIVSSTALGDTLWATPALRSLRRSFKDSYLAVLTSPLGYSVLKKNPDINKLYSFKGFFSLLRLFRKLKKEKFDTILIFHASQRIMIPFCATLGASHFIGSQGMSKDLDHLFTKCLDTSSLHEIHRRLELCREVGAYLFSYDMIFPIEASLRQEASLWLQERGGKGKWVGIHVGATDAYKEWPLEYFEEVAKTLLKEGYKILFTGGAKEKERLEKLLISVPGAVVTLPLVSLEFLASLIEKCCLFLSNDTGPMHLAIASRTPVVALFVPTDSRLCGPLNYPKAQVIQKKKTCIPCLKKRCLKPFCFLQIPPEQVLKYVREQLKEGNT